MLCYSLFLTLLHHKSTSSTVCVTFFTHDGDTSDNALPMYSIRCVKRRYSPFFSFFIVARIIACSVRIWHWTCSSVVGQEGVSPGFSKRKWRPSRTHIYVEYRTLEKWGRKFQKKIYLFCFCELLNSPLISMCQLLGINCSDEVDVSEVFSGFAQKGGASNPHGEFSTLFSFYPWEGVIMHLGFICSQ